jgi:branched-chain amino acid transport system ATP-binding protein
MERAPQQAAAGIPADASAGYDPLIMSVDGLTKKYAGVAAVDCLSIGFASGSITGIVGPNGAGKTTLFGLISGTVKADEGSISYLGREIRRLSPRARARIGIARTFQTARFFTSLSVRENLLIAVPRGAVSRPSWFHSRYRLSDDCASLVEAAADQSGLADVLDAPAAKLPQALRKRLDLAIALLQQPRLLLLDEPTAGVGTDDIVSIEAALRDLKQRNTGGAILITSHDVDLISRIADRLMVMVRGKPIAYGATAEVVRDPAVQQAYLGVSHP